MKKVNCKEASEQGEHGWSDASQRFEVDVLLREHGYHIHKRCKNDEPLWSIDGQLYLQTQAEEQLPKQELRLAITRQNQYYQRMQTC